MFSAIRGSTRVLSGTVTSIALCESTLEEDESKSEKTRLVDKSKTNLKADSKEDSKAIVGSKGDSNPNRYMGPYCHQCEKDNKDWSTLKYVPSVISEDMSVDQKWGVFMEQSVCGNYWRLWSQTREAFKQQQQQQEEEEEGEGGEGSKVTNSEVVSEEALQVVSSALKKCISRNSSYYETVHDEEVDEADPLPPGPTYEPDEDWSDLPEDEPTGCSLCIFMRGSPCGNHFRRWDKCIKENPDDYTKTCFEVSKKMFECNKSPEFVAFQEADKHNKNVRKERKDREPSTHSREDMLTTMRWELNSIIKPSPDLIPTEAVDFGDEIRVDLRVILDDEGYEQKNFGEWKKEREGSMSDPVTHCYIKDRQNNLLGIATIGEGIRNTRDLTCKRNSGILRGKVPLFDGEVDVFIKRGNIIYKTAVSLVPWDKRGKKEEEGEGSEDKE